MSLLASLLARWSGPGRTPIDPEAFTDRFADRLRIRLPVAHPRALVELQQQAQAVHADAAYALTPRLFRRSVDGHLALFDP